MLPKKNISVATLALIFSLVAVPKAIAASPLSFGSTLTQPPAASNFLVAPSDQTHGIQTNGINPAFKQRFDNPSTETPETPVTSFASDSTDAAQSPPSLNPPRTAQSGLWGGLWGFLPILAMLGLGWGWYRSRQSQNQTAEDSNLPNNSKLSDHNPTQSLTEDASQQPINTEESDQKLQEAKTEPPASVSEKNNHAETLVAEDNSPVEQSIGAETSDQSKNPLTASTEVTEETPRKAEMAPRVDSEAGDRFPAIADSEQTGEGFPTTKVAEPEAAVSSTETLKTSETSISGQESSDQPAGEMARDFTSTTKADSESIQTTPSADDNLIDMATTEPPQGSNLKADQAKSDTNFNDRTPSDIEAAKFNLGQTEPVEPQLASVDEGLPELPNGYGKTKIVLMPREPNSAYAYWDIPNADKEKLRKQGGEQLALRFYDVTGIDMDQQKPHSVRQYDCEEMTREWYIEVPMSDHDYIVEIGYMTEAGRWLVLARSLHVRIPPVYPCDWYGDDFRTVNWEDNLHSS